MKQDDPIIKELQDAVETTALFEVEVILNKYGGELIKKDEGNYIGYIPTIEHPIFTCSPEKDSVALLTIYLDEHRYMTYVTQYKENRTITPHWESNISYEDWKDSHKKVYDISTREDTPRFFDNTPPSDIDVEYYLIGDDWD